MLVWRHQLTAFISLIAAFIALNSANGDNLLTIDGKQLAVNVSPQISYLFDPDQDFTVAGLIDQPQKFTLNAKPQLNLGLVRDDIWLRISFKSTEAVSNHSNPNWYFNLGLIHIDKLDYYHYINGELRNEFHGGKNLSFAERPIQNHQWILPANLSPGEHLILVRLNTRMLVQANQSIENSESILLKSSASHLTNGLLFGFFSLLMIFTLIIYLVSKEIVFLTAFGILAGFLFFQISFTGLGFQFLWPDSPELNPILIRFPLAMIFCMTGCFIVSYLHLTSWAMPLARIILFCSALTALPAVFPLFQILPLAAFFILTTIPCLSIYASILAYRQKVLGSRILLSAFITFGFFVGLTFIASNGLIPPSPFAINYFNFGMLTMALIISVGLANRFNEEKLAAQVAEQAASAKSSFLASMSHEIRTPMNGVLGMLRLLKKTELTDKQSNYLHMADLSASSLLVVINDILDFSKIEAGKLDIEKLDFNLVLQIESIIESMAYPAQEKGLEIILDTREISQSQVNGDPSRLRQILTNLLSNAVKFTHQGEIVLTVRLNETDAGLTLFCSVKDTGIGIASDKAEHLFDSFTQEDSSTTRQYGGTGLGLAIAKNLCQMMDGDLNMESTPGQGSEFCMTIMLQPSATNDTRIDEESRATKLNGFNILIVDQSETASVVLAGQLEQLGAQVVLLNQPLDELPVKDGQQSVAEFNIIFVDSHLNHPSATEMAKRVRPNLARSNGQIILMTDFSGILDQPQLQRQGFTANICKPVTQTSLTDHLQLCDHEEISPDPVNTPNTTPVNNPLRNSRVLLVEDNLINREVALGVLEDLGVVPDMVENGAQAIIALKDSDPVYDLVLMDCQMPVMDGYEATQKIRLGSAGERMKNIPILAMTANAMKGDREKCLNAGMNDYLQKPIDIDRLEHKLIHWIELQPHKSHQP